MADPVVPTKPAAGAIPAPNELARCVLLLNREKTPVTAHITIPATHETLYSATQLATQDGRVSGAATNGKGEGVGQIIINRQPASADNSQSLRPTSCDVDGKTYPVVIPDGVEKRLFSPSAPKIS